MKKARDLVFAAIVLFVLVLSFINVFCMKNEKFWEISVGNAITILVALVVSYYFSKRNQDDKHKKEIYLNLMYKLQSAITDDSLVHISVDTDISLILMKKRQISSYIYLLKEQAYRFDLMEEMEFINDKFNEYTYTIGNHQEDRDYLVKSYLELKRPLDLIEPKLFEAMLKLYR